MSIALVGAIKIQKTRILAARTFPGPAPPARGDYCKAFAEHGVGSSEAANKEFGRFLKEVGDLQEVTALDACRKYALVAGKAVKERLMDIITDPLSVDLAFPLEEE